MMVVDHRGQHLEVVRSNISLITLTVALLCQPAAAARVTGSATGLPRIPNCSRKTRALRAEGTYPERAPAKTRNSRPRKTIGCAGCSVPRERLLMTSSSPNCSRSIRIPIASSSKSIKATGDGVEIGHAVIDDFGVMGQVIHVNPHSATTILISDPEHAVPVQFVRSGTRSVAFGRGSTSQLELRYLPATADIEVGDELVTSGTGAGVSRRIIRSHKVIAINEDRVRGFVSVLAEPRARLDSSREVSRYQAAQLRRFCMYQVTLPGHLIMSLLVALDPDDPAVSRLGADLSPPTSLRWY